MKIVPKILAILGTLAGTPFAQASFFFESELSAGIEGAPKANHFAASTVDEYGKNWSGLQIPLETARQYEEIDPMLSLRLGGSFKTLTVLFDFPLRKDLEAWYRDGVSSNVTCKPSNIDINVPVRGYARWEYGAGFVQAGRFKPDMGPSPNTLALGGAPYHDAVHWNFSPGFFRYDFFLSSLNAHLHGTPSSPGASPDSLTEAWKQENLQIDNQRNRVYAEPYKTLVYHRIGLDFRRVWFYVIEQSVVGGKQVEWRTINPFMFWHDNYATGYTKANATLELGLRPIRGSSFYYQIGIDDIKSPVGETGKNSTRSILSHLVGYRQIVETKSAGTFDFRLDAVLTDPAAGNERLPLLKYTSRRLYKSNYREQSDPNFADMFFVDYPLGYRRGPDAKDLWFTAGWIFGRHALNLELAWLRQGDKELYTDYDKAIACKRSLSGTVERQYVADLSYAIKLAYGFSAKVGGGVRRYRNLEHVLGDDGIDGWGVFSVSWDFSYQKIF